MRIARRLSCLCLFTVATAGAATPPPPTPIEAPRSTLLSYRDEGEFLAALGRWRAAVLKKQSILDRLRREAPAGVASMAAPVLESEAGKNESITNVQTAGVDEGGIVKRAGDYLVMLRRGRLSTVRIGGDALAVADTSPAYGPDVNPGSTWYDELLVSGRTVVVIGYSYERGGTEIGIFDLGADGSLAYRATHQLRSFDYYSSRNYASRLVGSKLVFYSPSYLRSDMTRPDEMLPAMRRWGAKPGAFERILPATRIFRSDDDFDPEEPLALHTVTSCDLARAPLQCESSAVLGPAGRVFYVSQGSVYVWTSSWRACRSGRAGAGCAGSTLFRLPLDGSSPSAIKTAGVPIDQMSFLEDDGGFINVLLRESGQGESMWGSERTRGRTALLRVPLSAFGDGRAAAQREHYRVLPEVSGESLQNRFVGEWLIWGGAAESSGRTRREGGVGWALRYREHDDAQRLAPGHDIERIEAMGSDALLVGSAGADLSFTSIRLRRKHAEIADRYLQHGARQGESRSHGFFFKPLTAGGGIVGLPMVGPARGSSDDGAGEHGSASVLYLAKRDLAFAPLGQLEARPGVDGRRRLRRVLRGLVRQRAAAVHRRPRVRAARLRAGGGAARCPARRSQRRADAGRASPHQLRAGRSEGGALLAVSVTPSASSQGARRGHSGRLTSGTRRAAQPS